MKLVTMLSLLLPLAAVACGSSGKATPSSTTSSTPGTTELTSAEIKGGSCNEAKAGICTDYADNSLGVNESACTSMSKGTWSKQPCAQANLLGTCTKKDGVKQTYYLGNGVAPWVDDAKNDCENALFQSQKGTFSAAPNADQLAKDQTLPSADHVWGSCKRKDSKTCEDFTGRAISADLAKSICEHDSDRTYTEGVACPTENVVGSCVETGTGSVERHYTSALKGSSMKEMASFCAGNQHWYPGASAPAAPVRVARPAAKPAAKGWKASKAR